MVSYQDEEAVGGEVLVRWDGGEDGEDQAAEDQDEPEGDEKKNSETQTRPRQLSFPLRRTLEPEPSLEANQSELAATSRG